MRLGLEVTAVAGRIVGRGVVLGLGLGLGAVWWWAVVRIAVLPDAGALEGAVAAGGWGLSLLPVHCVAKARAVGAVGDGRWRAAWRGSGQGSGMGQGQERGDDGEGGRAVGSDCGGGGSAGAEGDGGVGETVR